ncbi:MAG: type II toxin-antitoxin system RelE/ParE family toxin [Acidimicrobiales bacterium]|nr:type II toxin-antitoxin system RelE/ParE family toxin [Acidimicrobiales bacterium]
MTDWEVSLTSHAAIDLEKMPRRVAPAVVEFLYGPLVKNPMRVGKALIGNLSGLYSARRGEYRVFYELIEDSEVVLVHRISHRSNAYRPF